MRWLRFIVSRESLYPWEVIANEWGSFLKRSFRCMYISMIVFAALATLVLSVLFILDIPFTSMESSIDEYPEDDAAYRSEDFSKYLCNHDPHTPLRRFQCVSYKIAG